jgi:hypothetical protein
LGQCLSYDDENFDYYTSGVLIHEFIPDVTFKIINGAPLKLSKSQMRKEPDFVNNDTPFDKFIKAESTNIESNDNNDVDLFETWLCGVYCKIGI